ncbi:MAG: electron transfer flavoprotein subunit beta/FixA family protein [Elusimicrobia bacterium]|nr:electron transfer flavoprotein subunit beta/FixA family protein [Elusimicrobiota bacterium]
MPLNIVVCVKHTPATTSVSVDSATGKVKTAGLAYGLNPFDEYAVEEAVRLKERVPGSTATALTLGADSADAALREAVSRGIDAAVLVAGPEFDGGDSYATARALAAAVQKLHAQKPVHLVLFGKNTNDGNSGMVGAMTAAWLNWPGVVSVKKIESVDEASASVWRAMEDGVETVKVKLPAAISTIKEINEPRLPSLKGKMAAKKAAVTNWGAADLGLKPEEVGAAGAATSVTRQSPPPSRPAGMKIEGATAADKAKKLVDILIERKII